MNKSNLFLVSVVLAVAAPAADIETPAAADIETAAQMYTNNPVELLTSLSLSGCRVVKSNIQVIK